MDLTDPIMLARIQLAFTVSFHIIFPAFTIGLASFLAFLNGAYLFTGNKIYWDIFEYWKKIFAVAFGMGVVSGVVMTYQFGANWSVWSDKVGPVIGPLMGYEVLSAFFLEAGFLGVMLFGRPRIGPRIHFFATLMVACGTALSAFWILVVNSWMQTPQGFVMNAGGQFQVESWWAVIFNPSFPYRFVHMTLAAYLTTSFVVGGVAAYHLIREDKHQERINPQLRTMFSLAMWMAALVVPVQLFAGDQHGLNTLQHQPAKLAALEGHFDSGCGMEQVLVGWPNEKAKRVDYAISVPYMSSLILTHSWNGCLKGLDAFADEDEPPVLVIFWTFRIMVGIGLLMMCVGFWSLYARWKKTLFTSIWLHRAALFMGPMGFVAVLCGWFTTEIGRQPFTVYGHLRTVDSASPLAAPAVASSLVGFIIVYLSILALGLFYLVRLMRQEPVSVPDPLNKGDEIPDQDDAHDIMSQAGLAPATLGGGLASQPIKNQH